jgi:hypothetical protein
LVIEKTIHLDEKQEKQIKRIKEYLLLRGKLYIENLPLIAYELNFNEIFSGYLNGEIQVKHERRVSEGNFIKMYYYNTNVELMIGFGYKDNRIFVEVLYKNSENMEDLYRASTINLLDIPGHLYYDSVVIEEENGKIKSITRHFVRDNGKCLFVAKPDNNEEKYLIQILKK